MDSLKKGGMTFKSLPFQGGFRGIESVLLPILDLFKYPYRWRMTKNEIPHLRFR